MNDEINEQCDSLEGLFEKAIEEFNNSEKVYITDEKENNLSIYSTQSFNNMQYSSEEYECANMFLDKIGVPNYQDGQKLSLVGRINMIMETYKTLKIYVPKGFMNCACSNGETSYFISDTNDGNNWNTLKIELPEPKYKWKKISSCEIDEQGDKYVLLIDRPF